MKAIKTFVVSSAMFAVAALLPVNASADIYYFNCTFGGGTTCTDNTAIGTLTLTDTATGVEGVIDIFGSNDVMKVFEVVLNTNVATGTWTAGGDATSVTYSSNGIKPDGWAQSFDLVVNFAANDTEPYTFTLTNSLVNLSPANFAFLDQTGILSAAVHVGNYNNLGCSLWEGSKPGGSTTLGTLPGTTCSGGGGDNGVTVPEPASMLLFGLGALGTAYRVRRRRVAL
jgi:hypothetical protein